MGGFCLPHAGCLPGRFLGLLLDIEYPLNNNKNNDNAASAAAAARDDDDIKSID